jgi:hypothetical protein
MCSTLLIYPYKRIPSEITKRVPDEWRVGHNPTGGMTAEVFYKYIGKVFTSHRGKQNVKFPAKLSID